MEHETDETDESPDVPYTGSLDGWGPGPFLTIYPFDEALRTECIEEPFVCEEGCGETPIR